MLDTTQYTLEEEKDVTPRRTIITQYIREHRGATTTEVIEYMNKNGHAAVVTTHNLIKQLISEKIIIVRRDEKNRQKHHLFLNDQSTVVKIHSHLSDFEEFVENTNQYLNRLAYDHLVQQVELAKTDKSIDDNLYETIKFRTDVENNYRNLMSRMIEDLFVITCTASIPKEDIQSLCTIIIKLKSKIVNYPRWSIENERRNLDRYFSNLRRSQNAMKRSLIIQQYNDEKNWIQS